MTEVLAPELPPAWYGVAPSLQSSMKKLVENEPELGRVCPPIPLIFRALDTLTPSEVKVCILGQDPYHTPGKANGLCFGYDEDYEGPVDSSLANILSELRDSSPGWDGFINFDLGQWAEQGVLMINTRLSVEQGKPMSHAGIYNWEHGITDILKFLWENTDTVFMLWGAEARQLLKDVAGELNNSRMIWTSHPCRYSNNRTSEGVDGVVPSFTGSKCFERVNRILRNNHKEEIKWV